MNQGCVCVVCESFARSDEERPWPIGSNWIVTRARDVAIPGYLYLNSARHKVSFAELNLAELEELGFVLGRIIIPVLERALKVNRVYVAAFGEAVSHLHFHLMPRFDWMLADVADRHTDQLDAPALMSAARLRYRACDQVPISARQHRALWNAIKRELTATSRLQWLIESRDAYLTIF